MLNLKNTLDGYLKNVEVIGNTVQDTNNLANIRSVGDKVEGQEVYKIPIVSKGKNLFNKDNLNIVAINCTVENNDGLLTITPTAYNTFNYAINLNIDIIKSGNYFYTGQKSDATQFRLGGRTGEIVVNLGIETNKVINLTKDIDCITLNFTKISSGAITFDLNSIQIEPGSQQTEYEPYKEKKLEILSPVQLEKVGNVADRIICKDGVWGVEKNINTIILNGSEVWGTSMQYESTIRFHTVIPDSSSTDFSTIRSINSMVKTSNIIKLTDSSDEESCATGYSDGRMFIKINKNKLSEPTVEGFKKLLNETPLMLKYQINTPTFIPLPHDQQVKLRTFAGQTNIAFLTEIPGQIKAQVPKSLGATVNTHTEQIADLHNSLERVKKLEETTVSTIETGSSFTTVDATNNGYFEDVKLEGKTLVNLVKGGNIETDIGVSGTTLSKYDYLTPLKNNTIYTVIFNVDAPNEDLTTLNVSLNGGQLGCIGKYSNGINCITLTTNETVHNRFWVYFNVGSTIVGTPKLSNVIVLEGDHTNNPPSYFEGLMSVGQDVEEVSVESVTNNLFKTDGSVHVSNKFINDSGIEVDISTHSYIKTFTEVQPFKTYIFNKKIDAIYEYDKDMNFLSRTLRVYTSPFIIQNKNCRYIGLQILNNDLGTNLETILNGLTLNYGDVVKYGSEHQSNKKPLLYYNPTTEMWEKPVLREWDTIEKHSDGKYYYHKRSKEVVLNGGENWSGLNTSSELFNRMYISLPGKAYAIDNFVADNFIFKTDNVANISGGGFAWGNINNDTLWFTFSKTLDSKSKWTDHLQANPTTLVYQLAQEEVYECTNIDLMTYSGETNYIINSGAISPKSLLKVHNNISNVVKILQEKVSLLENTFIAGLKSVLSGDMYSLATILYPEDFEQNDNTEQDIMVIPE